MDDEEFQGPGADGEDQEEPCTTIGEKNMETYQMKIKYEEAQTERLKASEADKKASAEVTKAETMDNLVTFLLRRADDGAKDFSNARSGPVSGSYRPQDLSAKDSSAKAPSVPVSGSYRAEDSSVKAADSANGKVPSVRPRPDYRHFFPESKRKRGLSSYDDMSAQQMKAVLAVVLSSDGTLTGSKATLKALLSAHGVSMDRINQILHAGPEIRTEEI